MARPKKDETGKRYGRLVVLSRRGTHDDWNVRCDCGRETFTPGYGMRIGRTKQCMPCNHEDTRKRAAERCEAKFQNLAKHAP